MRKQGCKCFKKNSWPILNGSFETCTSCKNVRHNDPHQEWEVNKNGSKSIWKESIQDDPLGYSTTQEPVGETSPQHWVHICVSSQLCLCVSVGCSSVCSVTHMHTQTHAKNTTIISLCVHRVTDGQQESCTREMQQKWKTHLKILSGACSPVTRS